MKIHTILFDLDGVLVNSMPMWRNLSKNFLARRHLTITPDVIAQMNTMSLYTACGFIKDTFRLEETIDAIYDDMQATVLYYYLNEVVPKPGAFETVHTYKDLGAKVLLTTATDEAFVAPLLERFEMSQVFDGIYTSEGVGIAKDLAAYYLKVAELEAFDPKEALVFDDSEFALKAAHCAGMHTCCVKDPMNYSNYAAVGEFVDAMITSFEEWTPCR
ncbi:HAD family phosphatase [Peptoniphilus equinus]|uniref:HAD family phosphatase n=1 Tax=Peptoniphilus equinus TaxID=3016343 RepID=A0ABY7QW63_9FIRM|nr:HAD family phosphatase [Peptoniphilus equinus]WBW50158.1 HAD family phosphatase [Peptoniphilus equinus]